ncbi:MAG TPA: hypothetical protein VFH43_12935, partial [Candidatus Kapabacteria bacterium]|nr:hypothetical protein [Candidatus Kapabacteria bacterium]
MRNLYALLLLALTLGLGLSDSLAQTYTMQSYLVRTIPNDFQDISGVGTDITPDMQIQSIYDAYQRVSNKEYTLPFNFRWANAVSNKIKVTGHGGVIVGGSAEVPDAVVYLYTYYDYYFGYYGWRSGNYQYGSNNLISPFTGIVMATAESKWHMAILGTAPNRVAIVQASKIQDYSWGQSQSVGSWQAKLYESGISRVEYAYRPDVVNAGWGYPYGSYYGPFVGGVGKDWEYSTGTQYRTAANVMSITGRPAPIGTPNVYYSTFPQSQYGLPLPDVGYRIFIAYPYDLAASAITNPLRDQILNKDVAFTPTGVVSNEGSSNLSTATVNRRITLFGVGQVYNQNITITPPAAFNAANISFPSFTPLAYGIYYDTMEVISTTPADQAAANNITVTTYVVSPPNNMKAITITNPAPGSRTPINIPTPVGATFRNLGANNQINVPVSMVIYNPAGQVVYRDTVRFPSITSSQFRDTTFRDWTPTTHGVYRFCAIAIMAT